MRNERLGANENMLKQLEVMPEFLGQDSHFPMANKNVPPARSL